MKLINSNFNDYEAFKEKGFIYLNNVFDCSNEIINSISPITDNRLQQNIEADQFKKYNLDKIIKNSKLKNFLNKEFKNYVYSNNFFIRHFKGCKGTSPHADHVYFNQKNLFLTCWVALTKINILNSCLILLDRKNSKKFATENYLNTKTDSNHHTNHKGWEKITLDNIFNENLEWNYASMNPGDCILFYSDIVHASLDSKINIPRISLDFRISNASSYDERWFLSPDEVSLFMS